MQLSDLNNFYLQKEEPVRSCLQALREIILNYHDEMTETMKYKMPCFCYKGKMFCYLWTDKKTKNPYILIVEGNKIDHPELIAGNRARMKVLNINPNEDITLNTIDEIFKMAMELY